MGQEQNQPPTRAGGESWPHRAQDVQSQQSGCMSSGQEYCRLAWVLHIAQHLEWAVGLEHSVLQILHHQPGRQWGQSAAMGAEA